jgi:hypothetical protein
MIATPFDFKKSLPVISVMIYATLALAACVPSTTQTPVPSVTPAPRTVALDQEFALKIGEPIAIAGADLTLRFDAVLEDSRCPKDALCVQAGQARIAAQAQQAGKATATLELILNPALSANHATYEGYQVQLRKLDPYPETTDTKTAEDEYEATFVVTRETAESTPTADPDVTQPARYYNAEGGFSLDLPDGWRVLDPLTANNDPNRPFALYILGIDPAPSGGPGNSQIVIADPKQWTPEQFAQAQCSTCPASPFENVTLGGEPAQRTQVGSGGVPFTITWYFVEHNGKLIALAIHDPETLKPLDDVIQSIQFQ